MIANTLAGTPSNHARKYFIRPPLANSRVTISLLSIPDSGLFGYFTFLTTFQLTGNMINKVG